MLRQIEERRLYKCIGQTQPSTELELDEVNGTKPTVYNYGRLVKQSNYEPGSIEQSEHQMLR